MTPEPSQEEEYHIFTFDHVTQEKDDDDDDFNPYPIIVQYANRDLGEYQIEDVYFNIQSIRYFGWPQDFLNAIGSIFPLGLLP